MILRGALVNRFLQAVFAFKMLFSPEKTYKNKKMPVFVGTFPVPNHPKREK